MGEGAIPWIHHLSRRLMGSNRQSMGTDNHPTISNRHCMDNSRRLDTRRLDMRRQGIHHRDIHRMDTRPRRQRALAASGGHRALGWIRMSPQDLDICSPS
jgi:hypothetical protein